MHTPMASLAIQSQDSEKLVVTGNSGYSVLIVGL